MQMVQVSVLVVVPSIQMYISSTFQLESQPSPSISFPSSQFSVECFNPSPHCGIHSPVDPSNDVPSSQISQESGPVVDPPSHT